MESSSCWRGTLAPKDLFSFVSVAPKVMLGTATTSTLYCSSTTTSGRFIMISLLLVFLFLAFISHAISSKTILEAAFSNDLEALQAMNDDDTVDWNVRDPSSGQTALMGAVLRGHAEIVEYLLLKNHNNNVNVDIPEKDGYTPAHGAGFQGHALIMKLLHDHGVDINQRHADGYLPLHRACWGREMRHTETVKMLVEELGVSDTATDATGKTCREMTTNPQTIQYLNHKAVKDEL